MTLAEYPSTASRRTLSASQQASLQQAVNAALAETLALPPAKRDTEASRRFIASYALDGAVQALEPLIWGSGAEPSPTEKSIRIRALTLAEKLSLAPPSLPLQTLLDLAVIYAPIRPKQMRAVVENAIKTSPSTLDHLSDFIAAMSRLLHDSTGLYGLRKASHVLVCLLKVAPVEVVRALGTKDFLVALAVCYDGAMDRISRVYGGMRATGDRALDDWERIWIDTKVAIIDAFHAIFSRVLQDTTSAHTRADIETAFELVFALLEVSRSAPNSTQTPFLDRPLLVDYQQSYDLAKTLRNALKRASDEDARLELLESSLREFEDHGPGVLKLVIKSSGIPPGIDYRGSGKGKGKAEPETSSFSDPDIDIKVAQVLDILPDISPAYVRALLSHPSHPFHGNAERVMEVLLEGTAPSQEELMQASIIPAAPEQERRNVFDDEELDISKLHVGKKQQDEAVILRDRTFIDQMKADILRRAEMGSDSEDEELEAGGGIAFDDEAENDRIRVAGDGEESEDDEHATPEPPSVDTILEMAYIKDSRVFDRESRKSKAREDLKQKTGWADDLLESWGTMFERNPKKDKILMKYEFSGNQPSIPDAGPSNAQRGRGRGRGRGGRGGRGGGAPGGSEARNRAMKDKRGNQARKRGHDKKMARGGPPVS
ncbi:hypothetical protein CYLTODRAFT_484797 [Cylindrobasidium torrendii FP15055 ss-10]|uniref:CUE domain-containing protein n=1 Tax=Cylindrobasidium torrendii FP15055 ss-10 TaxID=1314674 RepID=A0A0D7BUV7_9AGAR|nr:hypothetical protein CYLTODRAFT_484797 [Cylindrobasidium torrendii FP15055 ss-10]